MTKIRAVIFDMDGVISDTERIHAKIESAIFLSYGIDISEKEITLLYSGTKDGVQFKNEFIKHSVNYSPSEAVRKKWLKMKKIPHDQIISIPGIIDLINRLKGYKLGVASGSPTHFVELVLKILGIRDKFRVVSGGDQVSEGKPNPELFLLTAKMLNVDPKNCIVIEDSSNGIKSAKSAGMKCIAITTTHHPKELKSADKIITSFDELTPAIIQSL